MVSTLLARRVLIAMRLASGAPHRILARVVPVTRRSDIVKIFAIAAVLALVF
jgi:hypothetical protein